MNMYSKLIFLVFLQLNLIGNCNELSAEEIQELWVQADIDGNGVVDYKEFKVSYRIRKHIKLKRNGFDLIIVGIYFLYADIILIDCSNGYGRPLVVSKGSRPVMIGTTTWSTGQSKLLDSV